jgi:hypothetical protein
MSWVSVPQGYDSPAGEKLRIIYEVDIPEWLDWTPDFIVDWVTNGVAGIWFQIQRAVADFDVERYEVVTVQPGRVYQIIIYGTSRGVDPWTAAIVILSLILAILIVATIFVRDVQKWIPPSAVNIGVFALLIIGLAMLAKEFKGRD